MRWIGIGVAVALLVATSGASARPTTCADSVTTSVPQPTAAQLAAAGLGRLPIAPQDKRVDLVAPPFSDPTSITNPLFPISELHSVVLNGKVEGKPFRTETTLLGERRIVEWSPGQCVSTLVSQYVAYVGGRIQEVALDRYAQADDGSVWYFGEDVFNYHDGVVVDTSDSWLAGKDGPAAMIMPAAPKVGDVNRPENFPGRVFEEVAVKRTGTTVNGPRGPVTGALVARELHDDGTFSDKIFAPGYGEFYTASNGELEALAVAVPTDAVAGPTPRALRRVLARATAGFRAAGAKRWRAAAGGVRAITAAWRTLRATGVPPRLVPPMRRALRALDDAVNAHATRRARTATLAVTQAALDLELRYQSPPEIDRARFGLWVRHVLVDATAGDLRAVNGDVSLLEWIRDRFAYTLGGATRTRVNALLLRLRGNVDDHDAAAARRTAEKLQRALKV